MKECRARAQSPLSRTEISHDLITPPAQRLKKQMKRHGSIEAKTRASNQEFRAVFHRGNFRVLTAEDHEGKNNGNGSERHFQFRRDRFLMITRF